MDGGVAPLEDKQNRHKRACVSTIVCADEILPVEFLYGEYEAGLVIKQGF